MDGILNAVDVNYRDIIRYPRIEITEGALTFICGESGSGKSTLLKLFNAVETPEEGRILYRGDDVSALDTVILRRNVSLMGQSVFLFDKTIGENFEEYYGYRDLPPLSNQEMERYLELCCADFSLSSNCRALSGGERQRVYLAIFLSFCPDVLMLDEPTSALDRNTGMQVMENLRDFCKKNQITLIVVSHDMELAERLAEYKIVLRKENRHGTDR